jgi:hypothetical protein
VTFPDWAPDCNLSPDHIENALLVSADSRILLDNSSERSPTLESHLEAQIIEAEHHSIDSPLRHAHREDTRQPPSCRERLIGIE